MLHEVFTGHWVSTASLASVSEDFLDSSVLVVNLSICVVDFATDAFQPFVMVV